ncbi:Glycerophosphoryl diester phosphodiesterase [Lunatimonas lonarensis]|uniref:Glycerophosphoryl diester phosphodiesterase n=1 Tax=Lunatimonas lonarensis TaxID=1232681 RepID=R7ZQQ5_9BACT|nr:glycerophosphodiester phosphodiesterase family protein [Lunatimonas lonarensis]EON76456.1 Glycerophosphoryl diester phosphodiesterase [Lunatimonas lonarensis]
MNDCPVNGKFLVVVGVLAMVFCSKCVLAHQQELPLRGLCAHRGAMGTFPENTLPAFAEAIRLGAEMIEFDVQLTKDGSLVVMHDATVDRTTNGSGKVSDLTLEQIRSLDAGSWMGERFKGIQVPELHEVLAIMPRDIWLNIHLKGGEELGRRVAQVVLASSRVHQAVLAVEEAARLGAREISTELLICNMERQGGGWDYVNSTIEMGADFIQLRGAVSPDFAAYAKRLKLHGIKINYFGTDDPGVVKNLWTMGIDFPLVNDLYSVVNGLAVAD